MKYVWTSRLVPPLLLTTVVACVWYALDSRPDTVPITPAAAASAPIIQAAPSAVVHADAAPTLTPTIKKIGAQLQFSVPTVPYENVQKVEFYVEQQFVGAAYSQPYSVAVSEDTLTAGIHTVTAKIYLPGSTANSQPATFTATPSTPPDPTTDMDAPAPLSSPSPPPPTSTIPTPSGITATVGTDGASATLNWTTVSTATHYAVWRDGTQVATVTGTGYTDTGLSAGQTYDYQVVALDDSADASAPSIPTAVTMPTPIDTSPVNTGSSSPQDPNTPQSSSSPDSANTP